MPRQRSPRFYAMELVSAGRPNSVTSCELKKTRIGAGKAKANHLGILVDSEIRGKVNAWEAGTITCNYDGVSKHRRTCVIRAHSFGSNSTLGSAAPTRIGG